MTTQEDLTQIVSELEHAGDANLAALLPDVYDELRSLSEAYLRAERIDHTLQATALVHEAYVKLAASKADAWNDQAHFFRVAAKTMRHILVNHAVARKAAKRGGGERQRVSLTQVDQVGNEESIDVINLDQALSRLAEIGAQKASVVELRYFAGCTIEETARSLGISTATVEREWRFARAWLRTELDA